LEDNMTNGPDTSDLPMRDEAKLVTAAALYLLPLTIGLRAEPLGPNYLLMIGLMAISVSKVVHLREAVIERGRYPAKLLALDLALVGVLLVMFQLVARPTSLTPSVTWSFERFLANTPLQVQESEHALLLGWRVFWLGGIVLFLLIMGWTWVAETTLRLRRRSPKRYWAGWLSGLAIAGTMFVRSLTSTPQATFDWYRVVAFSGLGPVVFLVFELLEDRLFERCEETHAGAQPAHAAEEPEQAPGGR
jgi:uncharacterized membrane protein